MGRTRSDIEPIIDFFLDLFTVQIFGPRVTPEIAEARPVSDPRNAPNAYELRVKSGKIEKCRRMSVMPLGGRVESKSMCYSVIYDEPMVVKIPPRPITEFSAYLAAIGREHQVVARLAPDIACVFPRLETILKKVPFLKLPPGLGPEETENAYIARLTEKPGLQQYLKIDGGFVFFMNLSRHGFFNRVIESMHLVEERVRHDIARNMPEAFEDLHAFESLYGDPGHPVYLDLCRLYAQYEDAVDRAAAKHGASSVPAYQRRQWFFSRLAGLRPQIESSGLPDDMPEKLHALTDELAAAAGPTIEKLYRIVRSRVRRKNFESNRMRIKGLTVNVIELLYRLKGRQVAIRDLKPDNMFIDRYLDGADHILADPSLYGLGLIDLETAVHLDAGLPVQQPLLAGTPAYATPSHVFPNRVLGKIYPPPLSRIFYMQDWYAAVGIIFAIFTGRLLFVRTGRLMPEIIRAKRSAAKQTARVSGIYRNISGKFWKTAIEEFLEKTNLFRQRLDGLEIHLPGHLKKFLTAEADLERRMIQDRMEALLENHPMLGRKQRQILAASHPAIAGYLRRQLSDPAHRSPATTAALSDLSRVARYKLRQAYLEDAGRKMSEAVSCRFLLSYIFDRAFYNMHPQEWCRRQPWLIGPGIRLYHGSADRI